MPGENKTVRSTQVYNEAVRSTQRGGSPLTPSNERLLVTSLYLNMAMRRLTSRMFVRTRQTAAKTGTSVIFSGHRPSPPLARQIVSFLSQGSSGSPIGDKLILFKWKLHIKYYQYFLFQQKWSLNVYPWVFVFFLPYNKTSI